MRNKGQIKRATATKPAVTNSSRPQHTARRFYPPKRTRVGGLFSLRRETQKKNPAVGKAGAGTKLIAQKIFYFLRLALIESILAMSILSFRYG